ncbi:DUF559 domain-containing protein [Novosphingobium sp. JCM 18896]|nr:DUF559 domain-containing protein [Novosphingobium sp. JCM 18896]
MALRKNLHDYATARRLRRALSLPEGLLWRELKGRSQGVKLRKQHPVGPYDRFLLRAGQDRLRDRRHRPRHGRPPRAR